MGLLPLRFIRGAARLAILLPLGGLFLVGLSESAGVLLPVSAAKWVLVAEVSAGLGLVLGVAVLVGILGGAPREGVARPALVGTATSLVVLLLTQTAALSGTVSGLRAERELHTALQTALHDAPGWNGGAVIDGATVFAVEIADRSASATRLLARYGEPLRVVLVGVDNRAGLRDLSLDLEGARALLGDGTSRVGLTHAEAVARAVPGADPSSIQPTPLLIPRGTRAEGALALFPQGTSFREVQRIEVRVNGVAQRLSGRYFTLAEKRSIDEARSRAPRN